MSSGESPRSLLRRVARALGSHRESFLFLGGTLPSVYPFVSGVRADRSTLDVDLATHVDSRRAYDALIATLRRECGLKDIIAGEAPLCRYLLDGVPVDIMPDDAGILGFGNPWFAEANEKADRAEIEPGLVIRIATPVHFVATKLEAFRQRGMRPRPDFESSHDLEDVITVLRGLPALMDGITAGDQPVHAAIRSAFRGFLADARFREALPWHFEGDAATQAGVPRFLARLEAMSRRKRRSH